MNIQKEKTKHHDSIEDTDLLRLERRQLGYIRATRRKLMQKGLVMRYQMDSKGQIFFSICDLSRNYLWSESTIRSYMDAGVLPFTEIDGKRRVYLAALLDFIDDKGYKKFPTNLSRRRSIFEELNY